MAIKLKNGIRHWAFKWLMYLLVMSSGILFIQSGYDYMNSHSSLNFSTDYENSEAYYKTLDAYYTQVYDAYYGAKKVDLAKVDQLNQKKDFYYYVYKDVNTQYTNAADAETKSPHLPARVNLESQFYSHVRSMYRIDGEQSIRYKHSGESGAYFYLAPPQDEYILVGMNAQYIQLAQADYLSKWRYEFMPIAAQMGACALGILIGMIFLALGAGRRPGDDDIHYNFSDWIYLDVFLGVWLFAEVIIIELFGRIFINIFGNSSYIIAIMIVCVLSGSIGLLYWVMVSKRLKDKKFLSHTLIGFVYRKTIGRLIHWLIQGLSQVKNGPFYGLPLLISFGFLAINAVTVILGAFLTASFGFFGFILGGMFYMSGFGALVLYLIYQDQQLDIAIKGLERIKNGDLNHRLRLTGTKPFLRLSEGINQITLGFSSAVGEELKSERMKTELITNVSHDLRTPLTSILTYVDLLKKEPLNNETAEEYLLVIDQKTQRLKQLTEDLFEAAKASSGSLSVAKESINLKELIEQALAEYQDRFESESLDLRVGFPEDGVCVLADGKHLWRILDNLLSNALKYSAKHSRVYLETTLENDFAVLAIKNVSAYPLNMSAEELMARFTRADESRSTEGSGLGLSIAQGLSDIQSLDLSIHIDGDLFKAVLRMPLCPKKQL